MLKKIIILLLLLISPVFAGTYEDAAAKNQMVFLYLYSPDCSMCKKFDVILSDLKSTEKDFAYVKVNADTAYGRYLLIKFRGYYVPYIIMTNTKTKKSVNINQGCVLDSVCVSRAMKSFKEQSK